MKPASIGSFLLLLVMNILSAHGAESDRGPLLYGQHCARCHGADGEGNINHFPRMLQGELSLPRLSRFIFTSMPPDAPQTLSEDEATHVARYIHSSFYSAEAQFRRHPPRVEMTRMTGRQYHQAIADLMVSFFGSPNRSEERGLTGSYATINANGDGKQVFSRLDSQVRFDFMTSSPKPDEIDPADFAISWSGSVRPPASGDYEFLVRTPNSFSLMVNDRKVALIDGWVRSGEQTEFRGTIRLLAGRSYPLTLHFTKAGQGVKKPDALREKVTPASIELAWIPPGRGEEIIPASCLSPLVSRETLLIKTPLPPDDRSTGIERGTSVSAEWDEATTDAAIEAADYVLAHLGDFCGIVEPSRENEQTVKDFCVRFAVHAFKRPLTPELRSLYIDRPFATAPDTAGAIERVVLMVLKSPRFLYTEMPGPTPDGYLAAQRLSLILWDSMPDDPLRVAASAGQLQSLEQIAQQATRMAADDRCQNKLRDFFVQWLKLDRPIELKKDRARFPEFDDATIADLRTSLELTLHSILENPRADFRQFLNCDSVYLNSRLARLYGATPPTDDGFHPFQLNPDDRVGLMTHPYLLSVFANAETSSPIRRGVFLSRSVLGRTLRPPPDAVIPLAPELNPELTTRERTELQTGAQSCQACHRLINPLGFALERFDAIGRLRDREQDRTIDAQGQYESKEGITFQFNGARELSRFLIDSEEVQLALIEKLFYFSTQQPIRAYGAETLPTLQRDFVDHEFDLRRLMARMAIIVASSATSPSEATP